MNRFNKEKRKKYKDERKGLNEEQLRALDIEDERNQEIINLAKEIHFERFPEEYDFMSDSISEARERQLGKNPMSQEYIDQVNKKRINLGVSALSDSGMTVSNDTMLLCIEEAERKLAK